MNPNPKDVCRDDPNQKLSLDQIYRILFSQTQNPL